MFFAYLYVWLSQFSRINLPLYHIIYKAIICTKKVFSGESYGTYGYNKQDKFVFVGRSAFGTFAWGRNISEHKAWISTDTHFKIMKKTVFMLFKKESSESDSLSQFQTFSTALAATVGTGSVVGVGECIRIGGAGSVFWMWVSAFSEWGLLTAKTIWE